jgi:hypothetical protein
VSLLGGITLRHRNRGLSLLVLDCGCWVSCSDQALEQFRVDLGLDTEALGRRIQAQHTHRDPPRALRVLFDRHQARDHDWPTLHVRPERRVTLAVLPGPAIPLTARDETECS